MGCLSCLPGTFSLLHGNYPWGQEIDIPTLQENEFERNSCLSDARSSVSAKPARSSSSGTFTTNTFAGFLESCSRQASHAGSSAYKNACGNLAAESGRKRRPCQKNATVATIG